FSSIRRHTRFSRDWCSDVCSSDLLATPASFSSGERGCRKGQKERIRDFHYRVGVSECGNTPTQSKTRDAPGASCPRRQATRRRQIGRASCRGRVEEAMEEAPVNKA